MPDASGFVFDARPQSPDGTFVPAQAVAFLLSLRNEGAPGTVVVKLDGNEQTPVSFVAEVGGRVIGQYTPLDTMEAVRGPQHDHSHELSTWPLDPGKEFQLVFDVGSLATLKPGVRYSYRASHQLFEAGPLISTDPVEFELVEAEVQAVANAYTNFGRMGGVLAWIAAPKGGGPARLLVRMSASSHAIPLHNGAYLSAVAPDTRLAVSHYPPDSPDGWGGWVAAGSGGSVELFQHLFTVPQWRSGPIALGLEDLRLTPRFPHRPGRAVLLATGTRGGSPMLVGADVEEHSSGVTPWSVPLQAPVQQSACMFMNSGPIDLLLVGEEAGTTRIARLSVDAAGQVLEPERVVRTTPHRVLAMCVDRRGGGSSYLLLEGDRQRPDQVALVRIPANAEPLVAEPAPLLGWPMVAPPDDPDAKRPLQATAVVMETALKGVALALVDERGGFHAGTTLGIHLVREGSDEAEPDRRARLPHVAAQASSTSPACFTETGELYIGR